MEGKLAETASKRPLALTVGAAAVTLLVILGVLTGPSVVSCFNSADGMGQCLRGKMVEAGLVPAAPATAVAEAEVPAEAEADVNVAVPVVEPPEAPDTAVTPEAELDVTPPATGAESAADDLVAATFGLLRAEPDGSVVIAGSGTPGSQVELFANGEPLGTTTVEDTGDWVYVPDEPLPPGGLEITLGEAGKEGTAAESFIVVIDEDKTSQPLVVASTPGEASEVLQGLTAPQAVASAEVPDVSPAAEPEAVEAAPVTSTAGEPASDAAAVAEPAAQDTAAPETGAAQPAATEAAAADDPSAQGSTIADLSASEPVAAAEPAAPAASFDTPASTPAASSASPESVPEPEASAPAPAAADDAAPANSPAAQEPSEASGEATSAGDIDPAAAPPAQTSAPEASSAEPEPAVPPTPPTIDAIEKEGDRTFFAGAGPEGGTVRLYVDDAFVADATVSDGRWLVEAGPVLENGSQRVRADLLEEGSAEVAARAEVNFVLDVPATEEPVAVAQAEATEPVVPATAPAASEPPAAETSPTVPAATGEGAAEDNSATATPDETVPDDSAAPVAGPVPTAQPPATPQSPQAETPPAPASGAEPPADPAPSPASNPAAPVPAAEPEPDVPTMVAVSLGDPEAQRFASGKAIIRRGDNLWTIARRVYGEGIKYTTIYDANTGQIRDPDRIYPGQVFDLPTAN